MTIIDISTALPSDHGITATIGQIDAATDEGLLRTGIDHALAAVAAEMRSKTPALAATWTEVLRHGVAAGVRLAAGPADWTWFVSGSLARGEAAAGSDVETMVAFGDSCQCRRQGRPAVTSRRRARAARTVRDCG